jgi:hypothetical protein
MAGQQRKKGRPLTVGRVFNTLATGAMTYAGGAYLYRKYGTKGVKKVVAAAKKAVTKSKTVRKAKPWKALHGKVYKTSGKSGNSMYANRRGISQIASTVKRRRGNTYGRKTVIKAGPAARAAFKKAPRNVARGKVRSPSYALARRR